jgi:group I intron endonuclease
MRQPLDYKNGKIYVIRNHINEKVYVGATTQSLSKRFGEHKRDYKRDYNYKIYKAFLEYGIDKFYIELVENYPCENKEQLNAREGYYIRQFDSYNNGYNGQIEGRTIKEYYNENKAHILQNKKEYYEDNKDKIKQYREENKDKIKQYYEENKGKIKEYKKEYRQRNIDKIKQYYEDNKDKIKQYYEDNKDKIKQYYQKNKDEINEKITCECGVELTKQNLSRHTKSKKHQNYLSSITNSS